jgi:putative FmdB family regulatory protein
MPIYEYKCDNGHVFDVIQKMSDEPLSECQECGAPARRVLHPVAIHFKGSGFHNTDYKTKRGGNGASSDGSKDSGESKGSGSGSTDSSGSGSKPAESKSGDSKAAAGS